MFEVMAMFLGKEQNDLRLMLKIDEVQEKSYLEGLEELKKVDPENILFKNNHKERKE